MEPYNRRSDFSIYPTDPKCTKCGETHPEDELIYFKDDPYCFNGCAGEKALECFRDLVNDTKPDLSDELHFVQKFLEEI